MEKIFTGENILEFVKTFSDDQTCREFIANQKWKDGYKCSRCDNSKYVYFEKHNTRECTKCRYKESATAGTLFHKVKFGIQKAFCIAFEMDLYYKRNFLYTSFQTLWSNAKKILVVHAKSKACDEIIKVTPNDRKCTSG